MRRNWKVGGREKRWCVFSRVVEFFSCKGFIYIREWGFWSFVVSGGSVFGGFVVGGFVGCVDWI